MKLITALLLVFSISSFSGEPTEKRFKIETLRGDKIDVVLHTPAKKLGSLDKFPALIIAPGQGYHMDLPIIANLSKHAAKSGYVVMRFNWYYMSSGGQSSPNLHKEVEDMQAVIKYIKELAIVDVDKIILSGKSLGTMVAYSEFTKEKDFKALVMLTPLCTWHWNEDGQRVSPYNVAAQRYPNFSYENRPIHMTLGKGDYLCHVNMLYSFLDKSLNVSLSIVGGDHGLNIGDWNDPAYKLRNEKNIDSAIHATVHAMNVILGL